MEAIRASDKYSERVEVVLTRSRQAEAFIAAGSLATALVLAALPLELELRALGLGWIAACAMAALRRLRPGLRLRIDPAGDIAVGEAAGSLRDGSFVAPWLAVARWRPDGSRFDRSLLVVPDMLGREEFRRLRVILRWHK